MIGFPKSLREVIVLKITLKTLGFFRNTSMYCLNPIIKKWRFFLVVTLFIVSCNNSKPDLGFFEDDSSSCLPPCWNNIVPGVTRMENGSTSLSKVEHISVDTISESNLQDSRVNEYTFYLEDGSQGGVIIRNNIVYEVFLTPDFKLTLQEVVYRFGMPDYIYRQPTSEHIACYETQIYYSKRGIMLYVHECEGWGGIDKILEVSGEEQVNNIVYFPRTTESFEGTLLELWQPYEEIAPHISTNAEPWIGFGDYRGTSWSGVEGIPRPISMLK